MESEYSYGVINDRMTLTQNVKAAQLDSIFESKQVNNPEARRQMSVGSSTLPRPGPVFPDEQISLHIGVPINPRLFHTF